MRNARDCGASGLGNQGGVQTEPHGAHGQAHSLVLTLAPLSTLMFRLEPDAHAD